MRIGPKANGLLNRVPGYVYFKVAIKRSQTRLQCISAKILANAKSKRYEVLEEGKNFKLKSPMGLIVNGSTFRTKWGHFVTRLSVYKDNQSPTFEEMDHLKLDLLGPVFVYYTFYPVLAPRQINMFHDYNDHGNHDPIFNPIDYE